ncbi:MAG TPA: SDR family NAD(P)-dependent oxidoreductase [Chloroflexota bacterium]
MDIDLGGRVAIVTGAGQGIGQGIAQTLARHGARIAVADINLAAAEETACGIDAEGGEAMAVHVDVSDAASVRAMVERCLARWETVHILVNNAGIVTTQLVEEMPEEDWRRVIDVNLTGPFLCCQAVLPIMRRNGYGKIVNVASVAGRRISHSAGANYTASKAGLLGFTRHLAYEVASYGINVNAICPAATLTPLGERILPAEMLAERVASIPRGRLATPQDHANAVLFLVSDLADFICGATLDVDGGSLLGWYDVETYRARRRRPAADGET